VRFALSDEHLELATTAGRWASTSFGPARLRAVAAAEEVLDQGAVRRELADLGWLGLLVPPELDGSGGTVLDACLVAEQLARHLVPAPFVGPALVVATAAGLLAPDAGREVLTSLAAGDAAWALVLDAELGWPGAGGPGRAFEWVPGARLLVPTDGGLAVADDRSAEPLPCEDLCRQVAAVGEVGPGPTGPAAGQVAAVAHVGLSAVLVGVMTGAMETAVAHVQSREQFGRTIGSFQAVQHLCADMLVDVESSRTALYGAAWGVDHLDPAEALVGAATARAWAAAAARRVCETGIQLHGGMGYTWECDAHLYLRTALFCADVFGGRTAALDTVADAVFAAALSQED
jgi:alkylation response protein AidB-like acyl-CoA dehydrogenase